MDVTFDFDGTVALVTGASGALGGAIARAFHEAGASVAAADVVEPDDEDDFFETEGVRFYEGDFTDEDDVARVVDEVVSDFGRLDHLANIAGTWRGGTPVDETDADTFDFLFDVNLKTMFLASKHAVPHLRETEGSVVSVSARSSLSGGEGDGVYRASKAGVRLLTETIAEENRGVVRANAVMPSVIDTPMNREMMADADFDSWVKPAEIARTVLALCSDATPVTSGAAVPVYGEA
ncbi:MULTISPECIES: SDR family oxidoreductase [unclassified Haloferax]|uniref:SDR family oxidoreductase n=1 Tax=Haloferax TaxID=2251 RepID=UPI0002A51D0B|nr:MULTISPECIES: SDR family oxidoreductase [unclassified Haloferax]ELK55918.1 glucose 1-dehydrogenase [Haloferax sp. BAB-2207]RDZ34915.1 KR domain-containing protein [Haloferax sp. Atlit-24N]RLM35326.1 SDR family NAD(P)-dependent oxidoreductase [Haloferax sp. Atlit-109R]RLM43174.1 SDR family NAD(P)-dependent oxidoreductase [Haloferax sp. Atlit-105R]